MLRTSLIALVLLALPAAASASPFGELPFQPAGGAAACLRPTGKPGELVRWARGGVQLLEARADGLHPTGGLPLGTYINCPEVAGHPNGAAVLAAPVDDGVAVAVRGPGDGSFGAAVRLAGTQLTWDVHATISPRGDVLVTWAEAEDDEGTRTRVRMARRAPGGPFGPAETLLDWAEDTLEAQLAVGMSADGEAVVAYGRPAGQSTRVLARTGAAGAPLGPPQTLLSREVGSGPSLAVAPDGRALVGVGGPMGAPTVYERPPGGTFGPPQELDLYPGFDAPVLALRADGAAVALVGDGDAAVTAVRRPGPGVAFGAKAEVAPAAAESERTAEFGVAYGLAGTNPPPDAFPELGATFTADGRVLLTRATDEDGVRVTTFPLAAGAPSEHSALGGALRWAYGLSALTLADGRLAVAWTDDRGLFDRTGKPDGRLHLAIEGLASPAERTPPKVTVGVPKRRALRPAEPLLLPVRCSAACDVRVAVPGFPAATDVTGSLARAGTTRLLIRPGSRPLAPRRGRLRLRLRTSAPGARAVRTQTVRVALRRLPAPRVPRILGARARRDGDDVVVRWRTDGPVLDAYFGVYATKARSRESAVVAVGAPKRLSGRSFTVRLRDARAARYVWIRLAPLGGDVKGRSVRLKLPLT